MTVFPLGQLRPPNSRAPGKGGIEPSLAMLEPRKRPRQRSAQATFDAIIVACAQLLGQSGYETLTTNAIAERAGVSVGTLYEYFPNRESIVAALATSGCKQLVAEMRQAALLAADLSQLEGLEHMLRTGVRVLSAPENAFPELVRQAPFVFRLPQFQAARAALDRLSLEIGETSGDRIKLVDPQVDAWLISQMLFGAMLEIACLEPGSADRETRVRALARLTFRMGMGRDPTDEPRPA